MDLLLDRDGLWCTAPGDGPGVLRSVPVPGGMAPGKVWAVPVDAQLGPCVADLLDPASGSSPGTPTVRAVALGRLVAAAFRAAADHPVPIPQGAGWRWRAAPGPSLAGALDAAVAACVAAGVVVDDDPERRLRDLVDDVVDARVTAGLAGGGRSDPRVGGHIRSARGHALGRPCGRPGGGQRPDRPGAQPAGRRSADEPSGRVDPVGVGDPDRRADHPAAVGQRGPGPVRGRARSLDEVGRYGDGACCCRAWGTRLPGLVEELGGGSSVGLADVDVLEFVDQVAPRLQAAGFDVIAPGGLLRPSPVRRRLSSPGSGTGALSVDGLGLEAQVLVDGEPLTAADFAALAASKSELVSVRGRWLRIGPQDARRLAALVRRLHRPVTPGDLLADEAFEGIELDAEQVLPSGLRPARPMPLPDGVLATLRPYQRAGLDWLSWLADNRVGGILADDMGLGKTLQVLAWIQADHVGPTLVVVPRDPGGHLGAPGCPVHSRAAGGHLPRRGPRVRGRGGHRGRRRRDHLRPAGPRRLVGGGCLAPGRARRGAGDQEPRHPGWPARRAP